MYTKSCPICMILKAAKCPICVILKGVKCPICVILKGVKCPLCVILKRAKCPIGTISKHCEISYIHTCLWKAVLDLGKNGLIFISKAWISCVLNHYFFWPLGCKTGCRILGNPAFFKKGFLTLEQFKFPLDVFWYFGIVHVSSSPLLIQVLWSS